MDGCHQPWGSANERDIIKLQYIAARQKAKQVGARIRGRQKLLAADDMKDGGIRMTCQWTVEIEGKERPACVAETMSIAYAKR